MQNDTRVTAIRSASADLLELDIASPAGATRVLARRLVLATGRDGLGGPSVPAGLTAGLPRRFWAHSADRIDFAALQGRTVGDGRRRAPRRWTMPRPRWRRWRPGSTCSSAAATSRASTSSLASGSPGVVHGFRGLADDWKWRFLHYVFGQQTPPPRDSTLRVSRHPSGHFHLGSPITSLVEDGDRLLVTTPKGRYQLDFIIFATGFQFDPTRRPEFATFLPHARLWADRFDASPGLASPELAQFPDLGPAFVFQEKHPGACPMLGRIHCFNHHATLSHGKLAGDIPAVSEGAQRLARGLARLFFTEDQDAHYASLQAFDTPELVGDEWTDADAVSPSKET